METKTRDYPAVDVEERFAEEIRGAAEATGHLIEESADEFARKAKEFSAVIDAASELAQATYESAREQVVAGAKVTDQTIRKYPYHAAGVALGLGLLVGYLIKRK